MTSGRDAERELAELYDQAGFETYQPPVAHYREQDIFGLFDLVCFGHGRLEVVQVKAGRDAAGIIDWFDQATAYEEHINDLVVTFVHLSEGEWRLARAHEGSYRWVYDGREDSDTHGRDVIDALRRPL